MKITIRLIVSLIFVVALVAIVFSYQQVCSERDRLAGELERRTIILAESLQESVRLHLQSNSLSKLNRIVERFGNRERLKGVAVFDREAKIIVSTPELLSKIHKPLPQVINSITENRSIGSFIKIDNKTIYIYTLPLLCTEADFLPQVEVLKTDSVHFQPMGALALFHDASYIDLRLKEIWKHNLFRFLTMSILIVVITLFVVRWSITGPIAQVANWLRELRIEKGKPQPAISPRGDILDPLISEVTQLAKSLSIARARAEEEARLRLRGDSLWTVNRLKEHMRVELGGKKLYLVSNREPYMHVKEGRNIRCIIPAGGVVTALDPIMRVCDGVWIAHGGGDADREMVDANDKIRVPPYEPAYTLKRIWLTKEEEDGYYYGFSNEGLWPLCHIAHTRPIFRLNDWSYYQKVNKKFAETLLEEIAEEESPLVLIQDYQLALLPLLVKERRPDAKVSLFWHIPWPNPEAFGICPWHKEILIGMLGADLIGFHTQFYCNNFLDTVDRFLESKINWELFSVERGGHTTLVKPFPISVSFEDFSDKATAIQEKGILKENLLKEIGIQARYLGVGVDRIDYTKGIPERFRAIERFLEKYPEFVGEFTFIELGAPSRTHIKRYRDLLTEVEEMVDKINWRFQTKEWKPIVFLKKHHSHEEIYRFYKVADLCMVTSLHDGMNLVAKEFVASRADEDGVLILSQFTGASRELEDAIIVNPYDIEVLSDAIYMALTMEKDERSKRMVRMRQVIREYNIYRWAGSLITTLARLRMPESAEQKRD